MPSFIGVRIKRCGKIYDFEAAGFEVRKGDRVVIESEFGTTIGSVVHEPRTVETGERVFKKVIRVATEEDIRQRSGNEAFAREAMLYCRERVMARGIPMKVVGGEVTLDRKRIVLYFTADGRIDFRELVKDLAARFRTRIEMRQIGVRDEAKMTGGMGICGRELCCRIFLTSFEPISIKMVKQQELTLNPGKLSGVCGRLMCCLGYEVHAAGQGPPHPEPEAKGGEEPVSVEEVAAVAAGGSPEGAGAADDQPRETVGAVPKGGEQKQAEPPHKQRRRRRRRKKPQRDE